jgi:hypothetical protein
MTHHVLSISLANLAHDALVALALVAALLVTLVLVNVGLWLPGLLAWLDARLDAPAPCVVEPDQDASAVGADTESRRPAPAGVSARLGLRPR